VDVDRHAVDLSVERARIEQARRANDVLPAFLLGDLREVAHETRLNKFLRLASVIELRGGHRVAASDAADHDGARGSARSGNGAVDPFVACGIERLGELGDRRRLAARGPPMCDLEVCCRGRGREGDRSRKYGCREMITHWCSSLEI